MKYSLFSFLMLIAGITNSAGAQTTIADSTLVSGTWTAANSPYLISGRAIVPQGETLTIEAGTVVKFASSATPTPSWFDYENGKIGVLRVEGKIIASGTEQDSIVFTRNANGYWGTILMDETADPSSVFEYCVMEYGKYSRNVTGITQYPAFDAALSFYRSQAIVQYCSFRNNHYSAVGYRSTQNAIFKENKVYQNDTHGFFSHKSDVNLTNNVFYGNSYGATGYVSAIYCSESNNNIVGNLIYNNDDFGIFLIDSSNLLVNNTIDGNYQAFRLENNGNAEIYNCIITNSEDENFATSAAGSGVINLYNSLTSSEDLPQNVNDIIGNLLNADPLFKDISASDYTLSPASQCINSGNADTNGLFLPDFDLLGTERISGSKIDLGAYEVPASYHTYDEVVCDSLLSPSGNYTWFSSGTYNDTLVNSAGSDSILTIVLTVNNSSFSVIYPEACFEYESPGGEYVWTASGLYHDTIPNVAGCDSIIEIHLTVNEVDTSVVQTGNMLTANAESAQYQWLDCNNDMEPIAGETDRTFIAEQSGRYAVRITQNSCTDTSACYGITIADIRYLSFHNNIDIHPNPVKNVFFITSHNDEIPQRIQIISINGELVQEENYPKKNEAVVLNSNIPAGVYVLKIFMPGGEEIIKKLLKM